MSRRAGRFRDKIVRKLVGGDLKALGRGIKDTRKDVAALAASGKADRDALARKVDHLGPALAGVDKHVRDSLRQSQHVLGGLDKVITRLDRMERRLESVTELVAAARDEIPLHRRQLRDLRRTEAYEAAFAASDPLVTVRIASYRNTDALVNRALASVLAQTHRNLQVVVVNDGPNPATREAVAALGDPRVDYVEFPYRRSYPENRGHRWMVAGAPGMNEGAARAEGLWIAPLDDDDAFSPDHVERLLALARAERAELAYGAMERTNAGTGESERIFSYPPVRGGFTFQGAIYHAGLRFFEYDEQSWRVDEPGDWNLCRRMLQSGVRVAAVDEVVGSMHLIPVADREDDVAFG